MANSKLERYLKIRNDTRKYVDKIRDFSVDGNLISRSARMFGILGRNKKVLFKSEDGVNYLMDFMIYEKLKNKKNAVMHYLENHELDEYENSIFEMLLNSYSSLFVIEEIDEENCTLKLIDYFTNERCEIVDTGLSKTAVVGLAIFFRKLQYKDIAFTSGISYIIRKELDTFEKLQKEVEKTLRSVKEKDESIKRFIAFRKLNEKYGIEMKLRDAEL